MHPNQQTIETFYSAFARFDAQTMSDCYAQAHWDAHYRFSATGRIVDNSIDARFGFDPQGRIASHRDRFDFWRWSRQALGMPGMLLGWSPMLRNKVRAQAGANLGQFLAREAQ